MKLELQFKTPKQEQEFENVDPRIKALTFYVTYYFNVVLKVVPVITSVWRTEEEQKQFLKEGKTTATMSPHQFGRAVDIRLNDVPRDTIPLLVATINQKWARNDGKVTALMHGIGQGIHIHLQCPAEGKC